MKKFSITKQWTEFCNYKYGSDNYTPVACMTEKDAIAFILLCFQQGLRWSLLDSNEQVKTFWDERYNGIVYYCDNGKLSYSSSVFEGKDYANRVCRVFER